MSFTTLPIDLYDEITSHLVGDRVRGKQRPIALGKVLALVCKTFRPVGQALVWRSITFDFAKFAESLPEVFTRFEMCPHLHNLINSVEGENEATLPASDFARMTSVLLDFLSHCQELTMLHISFPEHAPPSLVRSIFDTVSQSEPLEHLSLLGMPLVLDSDMIKMLHVRVPELDSLSLWLTVPSGGRGAVNTARPDESCTGDLRRLSLNVIKIEPAQISALLLILVRVLGAVRLWECTFNGALFHRATFEWLALDCIHVREMNFVCGPSELAEGTINLLDYLPRMNHILTLTMTKFLDDEQQLYYSEKAPFSLARFLSAIPLSMHLVHLRGFYFFGSLSYPVTRLKPSALALIEGPSVQFYLKTSSSQTFTTLKKMKDSKGILRWYRVIDVSSPLSRSRRRTPQ